LLLCRLVDILGLDGVLVPENPGNVSAFGLLTVDVRNDYVQTAVARHDDIDVAAVGKIFDDLRDSAAAALDREGFARAEHGYQVSADLRYVGQAFEVRVPAPTGHVDEIFVTTVADAFHDAHEQLYGYAFRGDARQPVEWVNLRVSGVGPIARPVLRRRPPGDGDASRAKTSVRPVFFDVANGWIDTPVYWRPDLAPADQISGPAVIEEFGSTVPLHPGFRARVDELANILIRREVSQ
jgi:N-methylhydantoinase A